MSMFEAWTPRELAALSRATAKLRAMQPQECRPKNEPVIPTLRGCRYNPIRDCYEIMVIIDEKRYFCGDLERWNEATAIEMQREAWRKYAKNVKK